ncbi:MAG: peptidylprolyl isomerase [Lachnospiraceae bacterium]|nr:peptidylprolyl isomerase [Lachnospiraceae bacterium]
MAVENDNVQITTKGMLEQVNAAITAICAGGQSYRIGSRSLTRADLKQLYAMRSDLTAQVAAENSGSLLDGCSVAVFDGR